jgi:uncharacterized membrane protein (Fun14 family)
MGFAVVGFAVGFPAAIEGVKVIGSFVGVDIIKVAPLSHIDLYVDTTLVASKRSVREVRFATTLAELIY